MQFKLSQMQNNAGQQPSPVLDMHSDSGSAGGSIVLQHGFWGQLSLKCNFAISTVLGDLAPCPPSLSGKYEVSIMVPLFLQCDGAWWLPLTGLSWLPYNSALVHRVVMVTLRALVLEAPLSFRTSSSIVDEFKFKCIVIVV